MIIKLLRISEIDGATLGIMLIDGKPLYKTLELPWRNNQPMISCIPEGPYRCTRRLSDKFGWVLELHDVPGRSAILVHQGNTTAHSHGCIIVGLTFGTIAGTPAVLESRKAKERLLEQVRNTENIIINIVSALD